MAICKTAKTGARRSRRFGSRWHWCLAGVFAGLGLLGKASAQAPAQLGGELPQKNYMSKEKFYLPVKIDDRARAGLREIQLYVKEGQAQPWTLVKKAPPGQTYFEFRPGHDGEYWFSVVTVDRQGRSTPADVRKEPPGLIVVHDTQLPQVDVRPMSPSADGSTMVHCTVNDANGDPSKTRFFFQTRNRLWMPLNHVPGQSDLYAIPSQAAFTGMVRVEACDKAKNTCSHEFDLATIPPLPAAKNTPTGSDPAGQAQKTNYLQNDQARTTMDSKQGNPPGQFPVDKVENVDNLVPVGPNQADASGPELGTPDGMNNPNTGHITRTVAEMPQPTQATQDRPQLHKSPPKTKHLVNNPHVFLQYQIDNAGPSGIGKVEVYLTRDKGKSWQKLGEDADRKSPAEIDLPGEGLFGVNVVVSNGRGFGGNPPAPGTSPDWWIEVDATKPVAEIIGIHPGTGTDAGSVFVSWKAHDSNLGTNPIDLFYALAPEGPWLPIAKGLKNDGHYRWIVPTNLGSEAYIRLAVHDAAGNLTQTESSQAVTLDDLSRPHARVTGVATSAPRNGSY